MLTNCSLCGEMKVKNTDFERKIANATSGEDRVKLQGERRKLEEKKHAKEEAI